MPVTLTLGSIQVVTGPIAKKSPEKVHFTTSSSALDMRDTDFVAELLLGLLHGAAVVGDLGSRQNATPTRCRVTA